MQTKMVGSLKIGTMLFFLVAGIARAERTGLSFLNFSVGAQAQALGGATAARAGDGSVVSQNAAAMVRFPSPQIFFYSSQYLSGSVYNYVSYVHPVKNHGLAIGAAFAHFSKGTFDGRDDAGQPTGTFGADDQFEMVSLAKTFTSKMSAGIGAKMIQSRIADNSVNTAAADLSASMQIGEQTRMGLLVSNLGPTVQYINADSKMPASVSLGAMHRVFKWVDLAGDVKYGINDDQWTTSLGAEANVAQFSSIRLGYLLQSQSVYKGSGKLDVQDSLSGFGVGTGIKLFQSAEIDYAFVPMGELGSTHHVSVNWRFN